jgi:hypothetical protein
MIPFASWGSGVAAQLLVYQQESLMAFGQIDSFGISLLLSMAFSGIRSMVTMI